MLETITAEIRRYCDAHTSAESPACREITEETQTTTSKARMLVGREEGTFLSLISRSIDARRVLEIGTFTGYSALKLAEGLPPEGNVTTCDVDSKTTAIARRIWAKSPHGGKITLKIGPALETIREIPGPIDLVFIDADKENYINYWESCLPRVRRGGLILVDNVLWSGRVLDPREKDDLAIASFNDHAANDERVDLVMLTVRDGLLMACKR
jgi:caffeoyl-CoA O-methyltransferase